MNAIPAINRDDTALIVVDVQNDFCHDEGAFGQRGISLAHIQPAVERLERLLGEVRAAGLPIIWIRNTNNEWTRSDVWTERREDLRTCWDGSWGAEYYRIAPQPGEREVNKHRYSAFINTDLETVLRSKGIKTLLLTGVQTNVCVESTARDGFMHDYRVVLVEDCCGTDTPEAHAATLSNISKYFGRVVTSEDVIQALPVPVRAPRS